MVKIDERDRKILIELLKNSRESLNVVARKVRLSRENVDYRIKRMMKEGIISSFNTVFDEKKLGLMRYGIFLELLTSEREEKMMLEYLKESKFVSWVSTNAGKWGFVFDVLVKSKQEIILFMKRFLDTYQKFIGNYAILSAEHISYYPEKMFGAVTGKKGEEKLTSIKIDAIDMKILSMLNENAWCSFVEIASNVGLTANAVNKRVTGLEESGVILGYSISLDWKKLGYELYGLQLKTIKFDETVLNKLKVFVKENPKVIIYYEYFGGAWDHDLGVIVKDSEELRVFINDFRKRFSETLKISEVSAILKEETVYQLPKGVFG